MVKNICNFRPLWYDSFPNHKNNEILLLGLLMIILETQSDPENSSQHLKNPLGHENMTI